MSRRIIPLPLSGRDRRAKVRALRQAHGAHDHLMRRAAIIRQEAAEKLRIADRLECDAWNAVMFAGGPASPSPAIGAALNAGYDLLEVQCNRCGRIEHVPLGEVAQTRSRQTPVHVLEAALFCEPCSKNSKWRQRAHLVGLTCETPGDPSEPRAGLRKN